MEVAYNSDDLYQLSKLREDKKQLAEIRGGKVVRRQMPKQGTYRREQGGRAEGKVEGESERVGRC